jgi:hypothetical protein
MSQLYHVRSERPMRGILPDCSLDSKAAVTKSTKSSILFAESCKQSLFPSCGIIQTATGTPCQIQNQCKCQNRERATNTDAMIERNDKPDIILIGQYVIQNGRA